MFGMGTGGSLRLLSPEILCSPLPLRVFPLFPGSFLFLPRLFAFLRSASAFPHLQNRTGPSALTLIPDSFNPLASALRFASVPLLCFRSASSLPLPHSFPDQALDRLVSSTSMPYDTPSDDLSTSSSLRGLTCFQQWQSSSPGGLHA